MEDWSEAASDDIQATDRRDYRGEDLPQVRRASCFCTVALFTAHALVHFGRLSIDFPCLRVLVIT